MNDSRKGVTMGWTAAEKGLLWGGRQPKKGYCGTDDSRKGLLWGGRQPKRGYYGMDDSRKGGYHGMDDSRKWVTMGWTAAEKGLLWDGRQPKSCYYGMDDSRKGVIFSRGSEAQFYFIASWLGPRSTQSLIQYYRTNLKEFEANSWGEECVGLYR